MAQTVIDFLAESATRRPAHVAVEEASGNSISYAELNELAGRVRDRLWALGVRKADRVGVCLRKSIDAYAVMLGAMKAGAAYVPLDASAPPWRIAFITHDCGLTVLIADAVAAAKWRTEAAKLGPLPVVIELVETGGGHGLRTALDHLDAAGPAPATADERPEPDDLAYILYTSGSTGTPKGVMLPHASAIDHVNWASDVLSPRATDRFSSHAPFHFDLSVTDLFVPLKHGATVVLFDADQGKEPISLARAIVERRLTVWYSTPTVLTLLAQFGRMEQHDYSALRAVLFAGEVFPIKHLRAVKALLPAARFFNLYGPTETNVCTWHPIPDVVDESRADPFPIGRTCGHFASRVVDEEGVDVPIGSEGELVLAGRGMLLGYFNDPERTARAFLIDRHGCRWYRTGDIVVQGVDGVFAFLGRRDRMVKRRGFRIELGEIEAGLYRHPAVKEAAAVALRDAEGAVRIKAFVALLDGERPSEIAMRAHCAKALPAYMLPDAFRFVHALPKTSTDKVDYVALGEA